METITLKKMRKTDGFVDSLNPIIRDNNGRINFNAQPRCINCPFTKKKIYGDNFCIPFNRLIPLELSSVCNIRGSELSIT